MKKVYLIFAFASFGYLTVSAQPVHLLSENCKSKTKLTSASFAGHVATTNPNHINSTILWSDDFSITSNWVINHVAGTSNDWVIGTNPPSGPFSINPINSVSAANNFAMFDSDLLCSHDQIANLTTANPINLSGHTSVRLSFSQYYRRYHDSTYVYVSNNGSAWTRFEVNGNLTANNYNGNNQSLNPDIINVDISSVAGNQDSVYLRFQFYSPDTNLTGVDTMAGCAYSWMIDDINIIDAPLIDGSLRQAFCGEYTVLPVLQAEAFALRGKFINNGVNPVSGAKIFYTITDPIGNFYYDTSVASATINPGDTSGYLNSIGTYIPANIGKYLVEQELSITGDSNNTNNFSQDTVLVDDSSYARDYTAIDRSDFGGSVGFNGATISFAEKFHVYKASQFTSASFYLNRPKINDHVSVSVYNVGMGGLPNLVIGSSANYVISVDDTGGAFLTLPFTSWVNVSPGDYFVGLNQLDTNSISLGVSNNVYTFHAGYYKIDTAAWSANEGGNLKSALMLRVNNPSGTQVGIKDSPEKQSVFNIYPNPSTGMIYITGKGYIEKDVTVKVVNSLGQVVKNVFYKSFMNDRIDLSDFPAGIYTVNIRSTSGEENKNVVLR